MTAIDVWVIIALMTVATILTRSLLFLFADTLKLPPRLQHALRYAPAAAMAAIVAPDVVLSGGALDLNWANPKLAAAIGALLFFTATRHLLGTIGVGMMLFTLLRLWL